MPDEMTETTPVVTEPANEGITDNQTQEVVTEPAKTSDNQEGQTEEVVKESAPPKEVVPYTDEELTKTKDWRSLDLQRLAKAYENKNKSYKELQGEFTKVTQRQSVQPPQPSQRPADPKQAFAYDIFQAFDTDDLPGVTQRMNSLNNSIERRKLDYADLNVADPERAETLKRSILADMDFKEKLDNALVMAYQNKNLNNSIYADVDTEIFKAMPGFNEVAPEIAKFATKELHFDVDTIENTMDAKIYIKGLMDKYGISQQEAAKRAKAYVFQLTKGMHDIYMRVSGKGLKGKEVRTPNKTEAGGAHAKITDTSLDSLRNQAIKTGLTEDWAKVYDKESELTKSTRR